VKKEKNSMMKKKLKRAGQGQSGKKKRRNGTKNLTDQYMLLAMTGIKLVAQHLSP